MGYVLIVESEPRKREALRLAAAAANHAVELAETWAVASRMLVSGKFDLVACTEAPPDAFVVPKGGEAVRLSLSSPAASAAWLALAFLSDPLVAYREMAELCVSPHVAPADDIAAPLHPATARPC